MANRSEEVGRATTREKIGAFRASIREDLELAWALARKIDANDTLELLAPVELSTVCFRVRESDGTNADERNPRSSPR